VGHHEQVPDRTDAILALLRAEGADRLSHAGGRTLLDHLRDTAAIVGRWGHPEWLVCAALIHSVYGTDAYHHQLIAPSRRDELAPIAGARAERLAYLFCATPRRPLLAGTHRWARDLPMRALAGAPDAGDVPGATRGESDALVLLHMANLADQARAADGSPGRWLVRLRDLGELLTDSDEVAPPACIALLSSLRDEDESRAIRAYAHATGAGGDAAQISALALAATACPVLAEPCVELGRLARDRGDDAAAQSWADQARARLRLLGTAWDKRRTYEQWLAAIDELERPVAAGSALPAVDRGALMAPASEEAVARRRFHRYVEGLVDDGRPGEGRLYPDLPSRPWHDPHDFALVDYLEGHFAAIRDEILALDAAHFAPESERIGRLGDWDVVFLYERGRRHDEVCAACPVTARGVDTHRTIRTHAGLIYISRMRAGTHISAHRGPTNLRLRCHLGITVPLGDCAIRVGDHTERWRQGRCLVFDDSYEHEAWNHTHEDRIVLIVDLWHPALSDAEVRLLEGLHAHTYRHARRLSRYWAANAAAARGAG
jgi:aspartyl/asparaginyl beta-hydroxylase/uncharacterized protein DUF6817